VFVPFVLGEIQNISVDDFTFRSWIGIIYGIFFSSALAYFANNYALTKMSASKIGMFHYVMPIASLLVAVPLLGEMPDVFFIVGSILVAIGVKKGSDPV
jgi:drug/metabolite transporter (DMT)-like permease